MNHAVMHNLPNFHRNALSALTSALIYGALLVMPTLNAQAVTAAAVTAKTNTTAAKRQSNLVKNLAPNLQRKPPANQPKL